MTRAVDQTNKSNLELLFGLAQDGDEVSHSARIKAAKLLADYLKVLAEIDKIVGDHDAAVIDTDDSISTAYLARKFVAAEMKQLLEIDGTWTEDKKNYFGQFIDHYLDKMRSG